METRPFDVTNDDLIFDVGAHRGEDTAYYLHRGFRVVGIEASPVLAAALASTFAGAIEAGRFILENVCITAERGTGTFWVNELKSEWSAFDKALGGRLGTPCHPVDVTCIRFEDLLAKHGTPHYIKIDIEGHDRLCLEGITPESAPRYISTETVSLDPFDRLHALGYTGFKCMNQRNHNDATLHYASSRRWPARMRREARRLRERLRGWVGRGLEPGAQPDGSWRFAPGSSGPFGEETPGPWLPYEEARAQFAARLEGRGPLSPRGWCDVHARR